MRVLLLTNLASLAALASPLSDAGHGVEHCRDVADFDQFVDCYPFDAVVIDAGMPGLSTGMFLTRWRARAARRASARLPGLVIAAPGGSPAADLLRAGADDVLRRPLDADEYLARLDAVSRRAVGLVSQKARLGNAEIDFDEKALRVAGNRIALTAGQFSFVAALARGAGACVANERISAALCGPDGDGRNSEIIKVYACVVRKKLAAAGFTGKIVTYWNRGYGLEPLRPSTAALAGITVSPPPASRPPIYFPARFDSRPDLRLVESA